MSCGVVLGRHVGGPWSAETGGFSSQLVPACARTEVPVHQKCAGEGSGGWRRRSIFSRAAARAVADTLLRLNGGPASDKQASATDDADDAVCIATLEADTTWSVGVFEAAQGRFIGTHFRSGRFLHETLSTTRLGL